MDASNMLKPALARGELRAIGATTLYEYRKHIEKDAALERRFQPVYVDEPNVEDTIAILRGLQERYEIHHGVRITGRRPRRRGELSHRYISDRFLPDKAIDLIDEAAARLRTQIDSVPVEIDAVDRRIVNREIEKRALQKEKTREAKDRLEVLEYLLSVILRAPCGELRRGHHRHLTAPLRVRGRLVHVHRHGQRRRVGHRGTPSPTVQKGRAGRVRARRRAGRGSARRAGRADRQAR